MNGGLLGILAYRLRYLHRAPGVAAMRAARSPEQLARVVLLATARNLSAAAAFLPAAPRAEATAALLACRTLQAYEHVSDRPLAARALLTAVDYLNGTVIAAPGPLPAVAVRGSEPIDLLLVERVHDVRALLAQLPVAGRERVARLVVDVGTVMALHLDRPLARTAYGERVAGRVALYLCSLVAQEWRAGDDLSELAGCVGVTAQLADDLRNRELASYGARDQDELLRAVVLRVLTPALGSIALLSRLGPAIQSRSARAAVAYLAIATTAFACAAVGAPVPYRRPVRPAAALLAATSNARWAAMLSRVRRCVDGAIHRLLDASPPLSATAGPVARPGGAHLLGLVDPRSLPPSMGSLVVGTTFALVEALPGEPLTGELPEFHVRRMMIADHLAFGALERLPLRDPEAMRSLATQFQLTALRNLRR